MPWSRADVGSLRALTARERVWLAAAAVAVPVAHLLLRVLGYKRTVAVGERLGPRRATPADAVTRAAATARLVGTADRRLPGARTCLSRSLALWYLLRWQGVPTELRLGVRSGGVTLDAHAWVEHAGRPLNDDEDVAHRYGTLDRPRDRPA